MDTQSGNKILGNTVLTICGEKAGVKRKKFGLPCSIFNTACWPLWDEATVCFSLCVNLSISQFRQPRWPQISVEETRMIQFKQCKTFRIHHNSQKANTQQGQRASLTLRSTFGAEIPTMSLHQVHQCPPLTVWRSTQWPFGKHLSVGSPLSPLQTLSSQPRCFFLLLLLLTPPASSSSTRLHPSL